MVGQRGEGGGMQRISRAMGYPAQHHAHQIAAARWRTIGYGNRSLSLMVGLAWCI
jgi:hypothetical protein